MHRPVAMRRWTIEGVEPQGFVACVDNVVASTGRDNDRVVALELRALPVDHDLSLALLNPEELVPIIVDLFPDLSAGLDRHQHQLKILARVEHSPEVTVLFCQFFNVRNETLHHRAPSFYNFIIIAALAYLRPTLSYLIRIKSLLFRFDRNAALAYVDLDTGRPLLLLVELITENQSGDGKHTNDQIKHIATHEWMISIKESPADGAGSGPEPDLDAQEVTAQH
jgi:hypothetical protein